MKPFLTSILLALSCFISNGYSQAAKPYPKEIQAKIKQVEEGLCSWVTTGNDPKWTIEGQMKKYGVNGLSIAVVKDYKIEWAKGYGTADVAEKRPVDEKTLFQAASISKSLNAVGVLKLAQDKKADLYSDINTMLSSWKFPYDSVSKNKKITVANLLSHSAGLSVHGFSGYAVTDPRPAIVAILDGKAPANSEAIRSLFEPGLKFKYSGGGTTISQVIVTDITGQAYEEYMRKNILGPIGMMNSSFAQPPLATAAMLATGYDNEGEQITGKYNVYPEQAAAGLWTNPTDLARFVTEIQLSYTGKSNKVLSQNMVKTMLTPMNDATAALGTFVIDKEGEKYFQHSGSNEGFMAQYYGSLEGGNGVVVMVNSDNGSIMREVVNSVAKAYNWKNFYKPVQKKIVTIPESMMDLYIGLYEAGGQYMSITKNEGSLWMRGPYGKREMHFTADDEFFMHENVGNSPKLIKDATGTVKGLRFNDTYFMAKVN